MAVCSQDFLKSVYPTRGHASGREQLEFRCQSITGVRRVVYLILLNSDNALRSVAFLFQVAPADKKKNIRTDSIKQEQNIFVIRRPRPPLNVNTA